MKSFSYRQIDKSTKKSFVDLSQKVSDQKSSKKGQKLLSLNGQYVRKR